ncbi:MAG: translation initiation factor IF-3 [Candidatus Omnitrophica bacterium]|nr:translation initiation factor IF-3 [Candidatus Omnitrophota bacterium]
MVKIRRFYRINENIRAEEVRVIGPEGNQLGVMPIRKARDLAENYGLDLVEVAPQASPPVCRIIDFSKFKYDQEKKERQAKKHQKHTKLKEIRLKPNIDPHDYKIKLKQAIDFLQSKDKVKVTLVFKGREMQHFDLGKKLIERFILDTQDFSQVERQPSWEGRTIQAILAPK